MKLNDAQTLALKLMKKHNLIEKGWRFEFDNAVKRFGVCRFRRKVIGLSRKLVEVNDLDRVKDTILHEIAHAIAGHSAGHGNEWKRVCLRIGAEPERCYTSENTNVVQLKYYAVCGGCGKQHEKARIKRGFGVKISCKCQSGKDWNDRILLNFKSRY